jgi:aminoglycoside phosphotransferase (APT) family kinase protein
LASVAEKLVLADNRDRLSGLFDVEMNALAPVRSRCGWPAGDEEAPEARRGIPSLAAFTRALTANPGGELLTATSARRAGNGDSKDIFIIQYSDEYAREHELVIRKDARGGPNPVSVIDEASAIIALNDLALPLPEVLWVEPDPSVLGAPYIAIRKYEGVPAAVVIDGAMRFANDNHRALGTGLAKALAELHTATMGINLPNTPSVSSTDSVALRVGALEHYWHMHRQWPSPTVSAAFVWLRKNLPRLDDRPCVVHGDASLRNLLVRADGSVAVLLDWENVHQGCAWEDISYARGDVEQIMDWEEFLAAYQSHGGIIHDPDVTRYFEVWRITQFVVWSVAAGRNFTDNTSDDLRFAYAGLERYSFYLDKLARELSGNGGEF